MKDRELWLLWAVVLGMMLLGGIVATAAKGGDCLADALEDCRLTPPATVAVGFTDPQEHEQLHTKHAALRSQYGKPTVYLGAGRAAVVDEPDLRLSAVAASVAANQRGPVYGLYLVQAQRWWERQPCYVLDEGFCYLHGTAWYTAHNRTTDAAYSAARAKELSHYATTLYRLSRGLPNYDARQLQAVLEYQWQRVGSLSQSSAGVAAAPPKSAPSVAKPSPSEGAGTTERTGKASAMPRHTPADDPWAGVVVLHYTAPWCSACRTLEPLYERLRRRPGVTVLEVDVTKPLPSFVVRAPVTLPTVLVFWNRKLLGHWSGAGMETQQAVEAAATKGE